MLITFYYLYWCVLHLQLQQGFLMSVTYKINNDYSNAKRCTMGSKWISESVISTKMIWKIFQTHIWSILMTFLSWMKWTMESMVRTLLWTIRILEGLLDSLDDEWEVIDEYPIKSNDEPVEPSVSSTDPSVLQVGMMEICRRIGKRKRLYWSRGWSLQR